MHVGTRNYRTVQGLKKIREEELYLEILYYLQKLKQDFKYKSLLNSVDKLPSLVTEIMDVHWHKSAATSDVYRYVHTTQLINFVL